MQKLRRFLFPLVALLCAALPSLTWAAQLRQVAIIEIPGNPGFDSIAFVNGFLVIAHTGADAVDVFDTNKRRLVKQIKGIGAPRGIAVDEQNGKVYVGNTDAKNIAVVTMNNWTVTQTIALQDSPSELLLVADQKKLYIANWRDQSFSTVDLGETNAVKTIALGGRPEYLAFDPDRKVVFVSVQDKNQVMAIDANLQVASRFPLAASEPTGLAIDQKGRRLFVSVRHAVVILNPDNGAEMGRVPTLPGIDMLIYDDLTRTLYGAAGGGVIAVIKGEGSTFVNRGEIQTEVKGHTLAFDPGRKLLYLPGGREGRSKLLILRRVDASTPEVSSAEATLRK